MTVVCNLGQIIFMLINFFIGRELKNNVVWSIESGGNMIQRLLSFFLILFIFNGCATFQPPKEINQIILDTKYYTSEKGIALAVKYYDHLVNLVSLIRQKYSHRELEFVDAPKDKNALGMFFSYQKDDIDKNPILTIWVWSSTQYNTLQTNFGTRASTNFLRYYRPLLNLVLSDEEMFSDPNITGYNINLQWIAKDFVSDKYSGGKIERIFIYSSKENCKEFISNKITNEAFLRNAKVFGMQGDIELGLIELDLKSGL